METKTVAYVIGDGNDYRLCVMDGRDNSFHDFPLSGRNIVRILMDCSEKLSHIYNEKNDASSDSRDT
jgi:hypothetical protein